MELGECWSGLREATSDYKFKGMKKTVLFHCNYLYANVGVPGVYQTLLADLTHSMGG